MLAGSVVTWQSKKQGLDAMSTCEAEFVALVELAKETNKQNECKHDMRKFDSLPLQEYCTDNNIEYADGSASGILKMLPLGGKEIHLLMSPDEGTSTSNIVDLSLDTVNLELLILLSNYRDFPKLHVIHSGFEHHKTMIFKCTSLEDTREIAYTANRRQCTVCGINLSDLAYKI
uniref:Uncharacterized protein n=1 Tax=Strigamia maritima TaxID=126957 RepID=T1JF47_STRMM